MLGVVARANTEASVAEWLIHRKPDQSPHDLGAHARAQIAWANSRERADSLAADGADERCRHIHTFGLEEDTGAATGRLFAIALGGVAFGAA